jgi:hypothetical protein
MKKVFAVLAVLSFVTFAGCFKSEGYKSEYVYNFVAACVQSGGNVPYCSCVMDVIQEKISQKGFIEEDAKFAAEKKFTENFMKVLEEGKAKCGK